MPVRRQQLKDQWAEHGAGEKDRSKQRRSRQRSKHQESGLRRLLLLHGPV